MLVVLLCPLSFVDGGSRFRFCFFLALRGLTGGLVFYICGLSPGFHFRGSLYSTFLLLVACRARTCLVVSFVSSSCSSALASFPSTETDMAMHVCPTE